MTIMVKRFMASNNRIFLISSALLFGLPNYSFAQNALNSTGQTDDKKDVIVVTASATRVNIKDAPASVSVITREDIERQPVQNIGELLGKLPGVSGGIGTNGEQSKIKIRGLPDNYTLLLVDGRRLGNSRETNYRPDLGRQDLSWISPDMIERIEVVRGPMSSLYGSDAMGGVVNIITRKVTPHWRGSVTTNYTIPEQDDRGDSYQFSGNVSGPITENLGLRLSASYSRQNPDEIILTNAAGYLGQGGVSDKNLNGTLTWAITPTQTLSIEGSYGKEEAIDPTTTTSSGSLQTAWGANELERTGYRLSYEGDFGFLTSRADLYKNEYDNDMGTAGTSNNSDTILDLLFSLSHHWIWDHKITFGGQYHKEELTNNQTIGTLPIDFDGKPVSGSTLKGDTSALFVENQITLKKELLLTLGARLDSHDKYGEHTSPRAYLVWHPKEDLTIRGGISSGFRAPTLKENSPGAVTQSRGRGCTGLRPLGYSSGACYMAGNSNLKPEESTNYEIGMSYDFGYSQIGATYFYTDFENKIEYAPLGFAQGLWWTRMENIQKARTKGIEATSVIALNKQLKWRTNVTWMIEAKNLTTGADLITTPELSIYSGLEWKVTKRLNAYLSAQYTGKQLGAGNSITKAYTMFDGNINYAINNTLTVRTGIQNIFDEKIDSNSGFDYYQPGRRLFVGATSKF